jgi:hypothetical protein
LFFSFFFSIIFEETFLKCAGELFRLNSLQTVKNIIAQAQQNFLASGTARTTVFHENFVALEWSQYMA